MNFKKINAVASCIFLAVSAMAIAIVLSCTKKPAGETFTGIGEGNNGKIEVSITVNNGKIVDGKVVSEQETDFAKPAAAKVMAQAVKNGNADNLDIVSGATVTSKGTAQAIRQALAASKGAVAKTEKAEDTSCDIVVIGAGGAGMTAAYRAKTQGANVILLEKKGVVGGNTNSATGGLNASETVIQKKLGIEDSNEQYFQDTMKGGYNKNDPTLVRTMVNNSAAIVDYLIDIGADLTDVGKMAGSTNKRTHRPQGGAAVGPHLVKVLSAAIESAGVDLRLNSKCTGIIMQDGKAVGVTVSSEAGDYKISAKAVIIATGGFGANPDLVVSYVPSLKGFGTTNHNGATGDAIEWGKAIGADFVDMDQIQTHPTVVPGKGIMITEAVRGNGAIIVNRDGNRFCSEMSTRDVMSKAILEQKGGTAFLVFDQAVRESLKAIEGYAKKGLLTEAPTVAELAKKLGIPENALVKTLSDYAAIQKSGKDPIGRKASEMPLPLEKAPYYAVEVGPAVHHTMGGLKIDAKAEVLNTKGQPIPGVFAAGEVTGGVHGGNRLGGNAIADIEVFGKMAADSALAYIK
ncbi:flavocytochrome c [Treponema parvum]|uniref:Urocanate reductase n=1 Tax=Treponema parvum TaxID=138851 RepID=A0A975F6A4_9SPIR|nr:flavocytochrome c [Treponema parvum]QTQ14739.1 flavocytochrome c [Treponema parvum]